MGWGAVDAQSVCAHGADAYDWLCLGLGSVAISLRAVNCVVGGDADFAWWRRECCRQSLARILPDVCFVFGAVIWNWGLSGTPFRRGLGSGTGSVDRTSLVSSPSNEPLLSGKAISPLGSFPFL